MNFRALSASLFLGAYAAAPAPAMAEQTVMGAWVRHEVELAYMGFTTHYSCDGLEDKTRLLLKHVGVRPGFKVTSSGCEGMRQVSEFPRVKIAFDGVETPVHGSKVVGEPAPAMWQKVTITRRQPKDLELGDCELVEQFRDKVLPLLTTRNIVDKTSCIPHQLSGSVIELQFEVLRGLPSADVARRPVAQQ